MELETDITRIEVMTRLNGADDAEYRRLLETCDLAPEEVDAIVHRHYREVAGHIECRVCGNCCKVFRPLLKPEDIDRLAGRLKISREAFMKKYIVEYEDGQGWFFKDVPCPFLVDNSCSVYPDRPGICRSYPNLHTGGFVSRLGIVFSSCSVCPIVYNVYEGVKREIRAGQIPAMSSEDQ